MIGSALTHAASTIPSAKQAVPRYLNKTLKPLVPITPDHCVVGPGIGAVFAQLIWHLCDEGEGVLMTAVSFSLLYISKTHAMSLAFLR